MSECEALIRVRWWIDWQAFSGGFNRRFAQRYMPVRNKYAQVVDQDWMVWICGWHAESMCLQGCRWRSYALEKCLEAGDRLVVEILEETDEVVTLRAHIFRVVPIPRGLTGYDAHGCPPGTVRMMYIIRDPIETPFPRQAAAVHTSFYHLMVGSATFS